MMLRQRATEADEPGTLSLSVSLAHTLATNLRKRLVVPLRPHPHRLGHLSLVVGAARAVGERLAHAAVFGLRRPEHRVVGSALFFVLPFVCLLPERLWQLQTTAQFEWIGIIYAFSCDLSSLT